jgi:hypothetical protein
MREMVILGTVRGSKADLPSVRKVRDGGSKD